MWNSEILLGSILLRVYRILKAIFWSLHDHLKTMFIIAITLEVFVWLEDAMNELIKK